MSEAVTQDRAAPAPVVAAFDFDGTLTWRDTLGPFLRRLLGTPGYLWLLFACSPWLLAWLLRLTSNHRAKARLLQICEATGLEDPWVAATRRRLSTVLFG